MTGDQREDFTLFPDVMTFVGPEQRAVRTHPHLASREADQLFTSLVLSAQAVCLLLRLLLLLLYLFLSLGKPVLKVGHPVRSTVAGFLFFWGGRGATATHLLLFTI